MCGDSATTCLHGACATNSSTGMQQCVCDALYAGAQCSVRSGNQRFELPLACVLVFGLLLVGLRVAERALAILRFAESPRDDFAFPRRFEHAQLRLGVLCKLIGTWVVDDDPATTSIAIPFRKGRQHALANVFVALVLVLELVPWLQIVALAFVPAVPWPAASADSARFLRLFVLHSLWTHVKPEQLSHALFYFVVAAVPAGLVATVFLGWKRFPLFKPQPKDALAEDVCSIALRLYSEWAALPVMIVLALPLECLFVGYDLEGLPIQIAVPRASCFTLLQAGQAGLGLAALMIYWFGSSAIAFQLNCEASAPVPTLWTDVRYTSLVQISRAPLALAVVAFANAHSSLLCLCCVVVAATLGFVNAWMRPCAHSLVNGVRMYGAVLSVWSASMGLVTAIVDDPTSKRTYEVWSVGAMGFSGASLAALLVFHTETFWLGQASHDKVTAAARHERAGAKHKLIGDQTGVRDDAEGVTPRSSRAAKVSMLRRVRLGKRIAASDEVGATNASV